MDVTERAEKFVEWLKNSQSWGNEHDLCFCAANHLVHGFALGDGAAFAVLRNQLNPRWKDHELNHKIRQAIKQPCDKPEGYLLRDGKFTESKSSGYSARRGSDEVVPERIKKRQDFDAGALRSMMMRGFQPSFRWLAERSPLDPRLVTPQMFLDAIFQRGEKTLVFTKFASQGQFGHVAGSPGRTYQVANRPGPPPTACDALPLTAREGAWFLPSPLDGKWYPSGNVDEGGNPILSRRSGSSVTVWRHMLLESDDAPEDDWLNLVINLPLPLTAIYTSGSRSIHALLRIDAPSKSHFDAFRDRITPILSRLGADPAAISGVRLTRLPGVLREGTTDRDGRYQRFDPPRLQRLLYLNPAPEISAIKLMPKIRSIAEMD
jgi:hypothetical protein